MTTPIKKTSIYLFLCLILFTIFGSSITTVYSEEEIYIGLVKYRGGDWYSVKKGLENFASNLKQRNNLPIRETIDDVSFTTTDCFNYPIVFLNGHGEILFDKTEKNNLVDYLENGGTLIVNDDYGLDEFFRTLINEIFPKNKLVKIPKSHNIFNCYYNFPKGLPKIHEHDGKPANLWGLYLNKRLSIIYIYNSDIADGWEKADVHNNPKHLRDQAYKFGVNMVYYILMN